jgi:transcription elongation factor/antiterminator RfaH
MLNLDGGERWFVVHTLPHQEKRAQLQIENQRYRTFLPKREKREKTIRHARKLTTVVAPFFPRYMFVILDPERDQWRPINGTLGVARLVMQADRPQPGIVETLIASTGPDGLLQMRPQLKVGDRVRLTQGPFAEYLGTLERLDDSGRVRVLLDMLGRRVPILVEGHHVGRVA